MQSTSYLILSWLAIIMAESKENVIFVISARNTETQSQAHRNFKDYWEQKMAEPKTFDEFLTVIKSDAVVDFRITQHCSGQTGSRIWWSYALKENPKSQRIRSPLYVGFTLTEEYKKKCDQGNTDRATIDDIKVEKNDKDHESWKLIDKLYEEKRSGPFELTYTRRKDAVLAKTDHAV